MVTTKDPGVDWPWSLWMASVRPPPGIEGRKPQERNQADLLRTIPFSILRRKYGLKGHILATSDVPTFSRSSWRNVMYPQRGCGGKTGAASLATPAGAGLGFEESRYCSSPQDWEILSRDMNPMSPRVLRATQPSGQTTRWVMLPLLRERRGQPSAGKCSTPPMVEWRMWAWQMKSS